MAVLEAELCLAVAVFWNNLGSIKTVLMSESWSFGSDSARILLSLVCPGGGVPFLITCLLVAVTASGLLVHPPAVQFFSAGVEAFTSKVLAFSTVPANPVGFWNIRRRAILFFFSSRQISFKNKAVPLFLQPFKSENGPSALQFHHPGKPQLPPRVA